MFDDQLLITLISNLTVCTVAGQITKLDMWKLDVAYGLRKAKENGAEFAAESQTVCPRDIKYPLLCLY